MSIFLFIVYFLSIGGVIAVLVSENRNPVKSVAWITVLLFVPGIGLIFYFFFGQDYTRQRLISKKQLKRLSHSETSASSVNIQQEISEPYSLLAKMVSRNQLTKVYSNNRVDLYTNGEAKMEALIGAIRAARKHIHIQYYIFEEDEIGRRIKEVLMDKARQGVEVRFLVDSVGCWKVRQRFYDEMKIAGVEFKEFMKVRFGHLTSKFNYRNHRKVVVIDGEVGFVGGMNVADRYIKGIKSGIWRDTHIRIEGDTVRSLQASFLIDWFYGQKELPSVEQYFPFVLEYKGTLFSQIVLDGPMGLFTPIQDAVVRAIMSARSYVYLQTPYFLPTETLIKSMQSSAMSGVDVRLMIPRQGDSNVVSYASKSYIKLLLSSGVKVYFYEKGFLHSKTIVADDYFSSVGSANLDFRSFEHNFEINALMYDVDFAKKMRITFEDDQLHATLISQQKWDARPIIERVFSAVLRILSPLL